ncbi:hypothetical protein ACH4S8_20815 [Streptomyces sp. NPDC021080]|uniref:hypothetical protein n=1 Tax=Streptomyces sp. NPDC021080 TaxID=3365110 RepID=UPI0037AF1B93
MTEQTRPVEQEAPVEETAPEAEPQAVEVEAESQPVEVEAESQAVEVEAEPQPVEVEAELQAVEVEAEPQAVEPSAVPEAVVPSMPEAPPEVAPVAGPAEAVEAQASPPKAKKDRRVLRAVLRWTAATVVFAAVGSAAAYGITGMERTDVPGLATKADGRWDYPTIVKPPLPSGSPGPFAESNKAGVHSADLRKLLLPAPKGAEADTALRGADGWLAQKPFVAQYADKTDRDSVDQLLTDYAVRHIAARGWTTADGTHTRIYLLQFDTAALAEDLITNNMAFYDSPKVALRGAVTVERDKAFPDRADVDQITRYAYTESKPYGGEHVREAYLSAGDVVALVVQSRKGTAPEIPFQQTVVLQSQLLG